MSDPQQPAGAGGEPSVPDPAAPAPPPASPATPPAPLPSAAMPPPPPAPEYAAPPPGYATPAAGAGPYAGAPAEAFTPWIQRVQSALVDFVGPFVIAFIVSVAISDALGFLLYLAALGWGIYNAYLGGQTGQSTGKKMIGTKVVAEATGQTIGGGMGIARFFLHIIDGLPCYLGYLWPLWDGKRQTFSDKIVSTVVVAGPKG